MPSLEDPLLIYSDLDGTLLDIHTYDWQPAAGWLETLQDHQIPIVLCSSKTAAEMQAIQRDLGLDGLPFIAENGAVIQLDVRWNDHPDAPRLISGVPHADIVQVINQLRTDAGYKFTTFDEVHEASVTLIWRDSDEEMAAFETALEALGLKFVQGARFWHILDARGGKDQAISWLNEQYLQRDGMLPTTLGLGDGPNDAPLLDSVDLAVVIKGINRQGIQLKNDDPQRVYHTQQPGPAGWREGLDHFFSS